jgi:hypothetical protein
MAYILETALELSRHRRLLRRRPLGLSCGTF